MTESAGEIPAAVAGQGEVQEGISWLSISWEFFFPSCCMELLTPCSGSARRRLTAL